MSHRHFRRAVVTGGAGFLGAHLCRSLVETGTDVLCVDDFSTGDPRNVADLAGSDRFRAVRHDVTEPWEVPGPVDLVAHLASLASPEHYQRLPVETILVGGSGCRNALELAAAKGARFVLTSTSEVYGDPREHPQRESYWGNVNPIGPRAVYDEGKRYAEALTLAFARQRGVDAGIVRLFNTYGPGMAEDDGRMVPSFIRRALRGDPLVVLGSGEQTRSLCWVGDTVRGILDLARHGGTGPINIGNPDERTVLDVAELVRELTGTRSAIEHRSAATDDPARRCPDIALAATLLGWTPRVELRTGLRWAVDGLAAEWGLPLPAAGRSAVRR
ncbi:NAD-dependent epimerase/dehydratase family protein [Saccharopolyspora sp. 7B]|uniref:NAD-dependent epimerase/dehydratase family protein n=1 Tax=Saccharopolyspora sp. 7B TaxID=2877240 RepID=UPI001CD744BA|nr:NAD-dependent epimerase/dehydratase family protein [Saccharopolyspora sp. 7B]MCA1279959.1 NAD-dependent epimerase/dehydratase family protein [Saccharopolyspora sp. 7B]